MQIVGTTRLSSKGQIVIPEEVRRRMQLEAGTRFVVMGEDDVVVLKTIKPVGMREFDSLIRVARKQARHSRLTPSAIAKAVRQARRRS